MPIFDTGACHDKNRKGSYCWLSSDTRIEQSPALVGMQTLLLREHNSIAGELNILNAHWSDEKIYQETRRIIIALYQHIVFAEYLPILIGSDLMDRFGLLPSSHGTYFTDYNSKLYPNILSEFTTAAFRPHNLIPNQIELRDSRFNPLTSIDTKHLENSPCIQYAALDELLYGSVSSFIYKNDVHFAESLADYRQMVIILFF